MSGPLHIAVLTADDMDSHIREMGALLHACVLDGASIGFITPFTPAEAETFWSAKILPAMRRGGLLVLAAKVDGALAGTVQLDHDTPANQPHRAEVRKMLVHPRFRRRGVARALMRTLENHARDLGRTLLTLDTRTGDAAEPLYASLGFETTGVVPGFCRDTLTTRLDSATLMYKRL